MSTNIKKIQELLLNIFYEDAKKYIKPQWVPWQKIVNTVIEGWGFTSEDTIIQAMEILQGDGLIKCQRREKGAGFSAAKITEEGINYIKKGLSIR